MSTNEQYPKFIDKDKILKWIDEELDKPLADKNGEPIRYFMQDARQMALYEVKQFILQGFWDFQRGSE